jgi:hypothetical protein
VPKDRHGGFVRRFAAARAGCRSIRCDAAHARRGERRARRSQLFHNLAAREQLADGGVGLMVRSARNYELTIAALGGAAAMATFLFLWERSAIEAAAKETPRGEGSGGARMFEPLWPYSRALGLLPPDQEDRNDEVGPVESDSPYDVISPYLHNVPRPVTPSAAPRPPKTASLQAGAHKSSTPPAPAPASASDFWVPDVSSLLVPAASLGMLVIPLAELNRPQYSQVVVWTPAPAPAPSGDPPGMSGPFHLFFTTDSPTGVAPVAESGGGGGLTSSTTSTVTNTVSSTVSSTTTSAMDLASSTTSATTALVSSTTSTATGLVSSVLRRH